MGLVRTALFNWAFARHHGGTFVFRIEDTDRERDSEDSYWQIINSLRWLGLDWDEGAELGGPHAPYRQSQRTEIYFDVVERLKAAGFLYESFSTPEEIDARNVAAGRSKQQGYDNFDRGLSESEREAFRAAGRKPALRFRVPDTELSFTDLVRGDISFPAGSTVDFVVVRPNGDPLYTLVNPVDDALMGVTHVLRGEDLLSSTPRQIALYHALIEIGVAEEIPLFGHLPYVMGQGNRKLSKRDPESSLLLHRERGFTPEGLLNYLSLLGWSIAGDRDVFSGEEMVRAFDIGSVNPNPARFDQKKADAINAEHIRLFSSEVFARQVTPYLCAAGVFAGELTGWELGAGGGVEGSTSAALLDSRGAISETGVQPSAAQRELLLRAAPLVQTRISVLSEAVGMLAFLFLPGEKIRFAPDALKTVDAGAPATLAAACDALEKLEGWVTAAIQEALQRALVDELGLKPRLAYTPLRVAVSGRRVSPPLFESLELLEKTETLSRLRRFAEFLRENAGI